MLKTILKSLILITRMTTSISSKAFNNLKLNKRGKRAKRVIEQIINDHKQLRNEEKHFIKITKPIYYDF